MPNSEIPSPQIIAVEILVVGAGPAGLTFSNLAAQAGAQVLVIERNASTVTEPRAVSIDDESLRTMQAAGLVEDVRRNTIREGYGYRYFTAQGKQFAEINPSLAEYGYPRRSPFRQPQLEATLRDALDRFSNAEIRFRHTLQSFEQDGNGVRAQVTGPNGEAIEIRAQYMIGADGASSAVRKILNIPMVGSTFEERWVVLDIVNSRQPIKHTHVYCNWKRPAITLPGPDGTRRWEFKLTPEETNEESLKPESIRAMLAGYGGDTEAEIVRKTVYTFHARIAEKWRSGRVFLAGDAAHLSPPFAGQGMNSGIRDSHNLAWKLAAVVRGRIGQDVLKSYEAERRPHAWGLIQMAVRMGQVMNPGTALKTFLLINAIRLGNFVPPVRDYFMQMKFKPKPRFTAGFLMLDGRENGRDKEKSLVGRMLPQPMLETVDGPKLLDDLIGAGFAVIAYGRNTQNTLASLRHHMWDRIGTQRIAIAPAGSKPAPGVAVDSDGILARLFGDESERVIVLRPDRYIAAEAPAAQASTMEMSLARMVENGKA